ncbi:carbohydrate porin [Waterburya agarophytonicola K14]|uniref:Carbohydrate porin n=1 Tax=Waterburya agarophytonicola KI4 TaxID=2874699 RepID=A0A964FL45_9CYAN|nr:iron uptake porin [Waterburya agarophytonicola]MCC0179158.1 carbohydrate porin [Waterburya agarophytonicola KI4]
MNFQKFKQDRFIYGKKSLLLGLPLALLSISANKVSASEADSGMSQINRVRQLESPEKLNSASENNGMSQITNVQQLRDVSPTDWAYEALRSLVDRYGCISGFPNQTYRGNQPLSRYEFAAGLNSCLNQIERLIASSENVSSEDVATIERLGQEFEAELATLGGRVDEIESQVAILEDNQFSTTTKFSGNVFLNFTGAGASDDVLVETVSLDTPFNLRRAGRDADNNPIVSTVTDDPEITFGYYTWLNFNSSFTGKDNLAIQLVAGNSNSPANNYVSAGLYNTFGTPFTDQTGTASGAGSVEVREIFYDFPIGEKLRVVVGPRINWYRYFDNNAYTFFLNGASSFNSSGGTLVNPVDRGSGAVVTLDFNDSITFKVGYLGENTEFLPSAFFNTSSDPNNGLFSATQSLTAELDFAIADRANIRLLYTRATIDNNQPLFDGDGNLTGFGVGGATGEPIYGVADDGFGGTIGDAPSDTFALNVDFKIFEKLGIFGRYNYGSTSIRPRNPDLENGEVNAQAFQAGVAFPDLGKEGALGTISFVVPFDVLDGEEFLASGSGDGGTQFDLEATYNFPVNSNLSILPAFYFINNPNNFEDNPNIYVGNVRMQFRL